MDTIPTTSPLQRRLVLIRHAKAVEDENGDDHGRALAEPGRADALALGEWLRAEGLLAGQVYCSSAARTRQTLELLGGNPPVILCDKLYLASAGDVLAMLQQADDANGTVVVIGHNPGIHALLAFLTGECANEVDEDALLLKFPTCACAVLEFDLPHWAGIAPKTGRLAQLRLPH